MDRADVNGKDVGENRCDDDALTETATLPNNQVAAYVHFLIYILLSNESPNFCQMFVWSE